MDESEKEIDFLANCMKLAARLSAGLKTKDGNLLQLVKFKKKGQGFYYSLSDKRHVLVNRGEEWFYAPFIPNSPYLFAMAVFVMVPEEEIEILGFN